MLRPGVGKRGFKISLTLRYLGRSGRESESCSMLRDEGRRERNGSNASVNIPPAPIDCDQARARPYVEFKGRPHEGQPDFPIDSNTSYQHYLRITTQGFSLIPNNHCMLWNAA
jgi:hypothetical protein